MLEILALFSFYLFLCPASLCTALLKLVNHIIEIGIAGAEASGQPVSTALGDPLAVSENFELTGLPGRKDGFNVEALLEEGHEARDLSLVVLSRRAVHNFNLHSVLRSVLNGLRCSLSTTRYSLLQTVSPNRLNPTQLLQSPPLPPRLIRTILTNNSP